MIIRYGGGNSGVAEYLENGRKVDRHYSRDELDRRVPIEGDLSVTQAIYESIEDKGQERYLHISLSFNEPGVTEEDLKEVFQQYKKQLMAAYGEEEYNIYAEIHWPKIKEAYNHNTGTMDPRYPHVHVVIPKRNILTGDYLNPVGMHEHHVKYLDAIQERLNRDNGLSSPRNSPRIGTNHYESALARYKDKEYKSKNGQIKQSIYDEIISRDIRQVADFKSLLEEYGEVRVRNESKENQYFAVKMPGDEKFTNLKANIFGREYIENRSLVLEPVTDAQISKRVESWHSIRSREIKYISNASAKLKEKYKSLSLPERRNLLDELEAEYDGRFKKAAGVRKGRSELASMRTRNNFASDFESAGGFATEAASHLHELQTGPVDYFGDSNRKPTPGLFLHGDEDENIQQHYAGGSAGLRGDLYAGATGRRLAVIEAPSGASSVVSALIAEQEQIDKEKNDLARFAEIRRNLDPSHLLAYAQNMYGADPDQHPISYAKDGSPRIKAGKYNYNVSDYLTKHIGLDWSEASSVLQQLYQRQQNGIIDKPKSKEQHIDDWRRFRNEIYPKNVKTYDELKGQIKLSYSLGLKVINSEFYARRAAITKDEFLTRSDKHYFRSVVILEKLQKVEDLQQRIKNQNNTANRAKYPYSTLFNDYATKNEELNMKVLDELRRRFQAPESESESTNTIGAPHLQTPHTMPGGVEAAKRARLISRLHTQERESKELKIKLADLRPRQLANNSVAFCHKEHGKQIFVNHPDRLELNRVTDQDEVGVALIYGVERFGSPLEINGTAQFKEQVIEVAAERDMDITFTDEAMNKALAAKRLELGLEPLATNSIAPQELEIDKSLPREEAIDKALLASKVAELRAVRVVALAQPNQADRLVFAAVVIDAQDRHVELKSPGVEVDRVEAIAREDFQAFAQLEGKPEQQQLAVSMAQAMENEHYKAFAEQNGPQELQLTIDATLALEKEPESEAEISARIQSYSDQIAELKTIDDEKSSQYSAYNLVGLHLEALSAYKGGAGERAMASVINDGMSSNSHYRDEVESVASKEVLATLQAAAVEIDRVSAPEPQAISAEEMASLTNRARNLETQASTLSAEIQQMRMAGRGEDLIQERETELAGLHVERAGVLLQVLPQMKEEEMKAGASPERLERLDTAIQEAQDTMEKMAERLETPEPLQFTSNGEPATMDFDRFQQAAPEAPSIERLQAEVEGYGKAEHSARQELEALQLRREEEGMFLSSDEAAALDESINQASVRADQMAAARDNSQRELSQIQPPAVSAGDIKFTHNGQPATLDLNRFTEQPDLSPAVTHKISELAAINQAAPSTSRGIEKDIISRSTLADSLSRHREVRVLERDSGSMKELARNDIQAFAKLQGEPEQQHLAREMGRMMDDPDYREVIDTAPEDLRVTIEAVSYMEPAELQQEHDNDMEQ